jgi:hypothetical protein
MKKAALKLPKATLTFLLVLTLTAGIFVKTVHAQVTVAGSAGTANGTYPTLREAFDALNIVTATQAGKTIVVTVTASTTEIAPAVLNQPLIGLWTSLTIYPTSAGLSISGDLAYPLIDLNGADNVTIDGRVNLAGAKNLIISNTSISSDAGTSTLRFIKDATNNTVKYCTLKGSSRASSATAGGILLFSTSTGTTGNDDNTIDNNDITNSLDANRPVKAIFSLGTSGKENSGNTISNNNIFNFLNRGVTSYGIYLNNYTTAWTITGNSFYETASFAPTGSVDYRVIYINNTSGVNFTISGNYIGGSSPTCGTLGTVTKWTKTNAFDNAFYAMYFSVGTAMASGIQGNVISNFAWANSTNASWWGISSVAGELNIGTTTGNTIGATTGTGNITLTNSTTSGSFCGISTTSTTNLNCFNNKVGSITVANTSSLNATNFYGIYCFSYSGQVFIANNIIGSTSTANSINASSTSSNYNQYGYGINYNSTSGAPYVGITGNIISNLNNSGIYNSTQLLGINVTGTSSCNISDNAVHDLTGTPIVITINIPAICGIFYSGSNTVNVDKNIVYNLINANVSGFNGYVEGIFTSSTSASVSNNYIHDLSITNTTNTGKTIGICHFSGNSIYFNNKIDLGGNYKHSIYGFYCASGYASETLNLYHNTINISGSLVSGTTVNSACLYSSVSTYTRNFRNNIFKNSRSTASGTNLHYAAYFAYAVNTNLTLDYNDYNVSGIGGVLGYYSAAPVTSLPLIAGMDANSVTINPAMDGALIPSVFTNCTPRPEVLTDYNDYLRSASNPKMGAVEFASAPAASGNTVEVYNGITLLASYLNIKEAFAKINDGTHSGSIIVKITGSQLLSSSAVLNASGTGSATYTDVTLYPTISGLTISGNGSFAEPLIDLNGADNVVIDGRVNGTGSTKSLTISNPGIFGSTLRFINDASGNTVKYCTLKGSSTISIGGILYFGTTTGTTGNDNNLIDNNDITNALDANRPVNAIFSSGSGTGKENSGNTISNNNIYDFLNRGLASYGINLSANTTAWSITGNSFYETASFVQPAEVLLNPAIININNSTNGQNFTVSGNFIGGSTPSCGGAAWTKTNATSNGFYGINMTVGTSVASNIQGNVIRNISWANSAAAATNWTGIQVAGMVNIGTTAGNTIGEFTGNGSIIFTNGLNGSGFYGINASGPTIIQNNIIGSITVANSNSTSNTNFTGITVAGSGPSNIKNNIIGSTTTSNSIYASSIADSYAQKIYGIYGIANGLVTINGNTIANLTNGTTCSTPALLGVTTGIYAGSTGSYIITNNVIHDITIANTNNTTEETASVSGITTKSSAFSPNYVAANTIYGLSNTNTTFTGAVIGLYYYGTTTASTVSGNFIHSLSVHANSPSATIYGIKIATGATTYSNNIINLGGNTGSNIYGFYETGVPGNNNNLYFNTVNISGTPASLTNKSYCLYSAVTGNTRDFRNNIFSNVRSTTDGVSLHYAAWFNYGVSTNLSLANNDYYTTGTGGGVLCRYNSLDVTAVPLIPGIDANSLAIDPSFASAGGTVAMDYYPSASLPGVSGTGTLSDFNEYFRDVATPKMGALESTSTSNTVDLLIGGSVQSSFKNIKTAFDNINDGTYTGVITLKITGSQELTTTAILYGNGVGSASYTSVTLFPTVTGLTISGNLPAPLIDLNGADHVIIDGSVNAAGAAKDLIITNTNATSGVETSTMRFINDATNNTVKYCTIKGSSMTTSGGIIYFASTSGISGNDNNLIDNNDITSAADENRPLNAVYSYGLVGAENSNNTISNNNIFNFLNRGTTSYGIRIGNYSTAWTISGNSFYETAPFVATTSVQNYVINIGADILANNFTVSNNYIGGSAPSCGGAAWTKINTFSNDFYAISMDVGTSPASNVQGNTIKNFDYSNSSSAEWYGIACSRGNVNIGTIAGNVIGSATGNGSIKLTSNTGNGSFRGINSTTTGVTDIRNNTVGSVTTANANNSYSPSIFGVFNQTGPSTIINKMGYPIISRADF